MFCLAKIPKARARAREDFVRFIMSKKKEEKNTGCCDN